MKTILTLLMIVTMISGTMAQTSREYAADDIAQFETDLAAGAYDVYILSTSGGVYDLTGYINIPVNTVIKAAEGLAEKPVIMRTNNTSAGAGIFRVQNVTINIGLEGLIFDGTVTGDTKSVGLRAESKVHVDVDNCVFRNFTDVNGVFRLQGAESSIDVRNSVFHDISQRIIHPWEVNVAYGHINIDNCLFYNINGPVVWFRSTGGGTNLAIGTTLTVTHSTFHNINTNADGLFRGRDNNTGEIKIRNSVFTNIAETRPLTAGLVNLTVDYCYLGNTGVGSAAHNPVATNLLATAPVYEDADNNNFKITNADDFIAETGDVAGVVWYYPPRVQPGLLVQNATQVKLVFSRPVDQTSAESLTNYTLSGTFGLTGNPTEAVLINDREVLLTIGDISIIPVGETIVVTVTGVEDTYGMVVADINIASFTGSEDEVPETHLVRFTVTYDNDGTPAPVEGAEITITGVPGILSTDAAGTAGIQLENGTYTYHVEAADFFAVEDATFMVEDGPVDVDVTLELIPVPKFYLVTFTVAFDDDGTPTAIEGAQITITGIAESITTNAEGIATIELENGTYTYKVEASGFVTVEDGSFVVEDAPADIDVTLEMIPVPDELTLTMAPQVVSNRTNQRVSGTSTKSGFIVIVKDDAPQANLTEILAALNNNTGASAEVTVAGENVHISTGGLLPGIYNGYAVDAENMISEPLLAVVTVNDFHSREYPVDQIAQLLTDLTTGAYDEYILSTSGGVYDLTSYVTITANAVIKAAEGLSEKPVLMRTNNTGSGAGMFRIQTETVNITLEGLIFDGTVEGSNKISGFRAESTAHFHVNNCVFRNFTEQNGVFRLQATASSMDVRNSVFHDNLQRIIHLYTPEVLYGDVNIDNCLFYNISGPIVFTRIVSSIPAIGASLTVNHSTFNNITVGTDGIFRGRNNNATGETKFLNSVFTNISAGAPLAPQFPGVVVDYCYVDGMDPKPSGTNLFTTDPVYEDTANNNFRITNVDDLLVASGDVAGVIWYYPPRLNPALLIEDATRIKLVFSRPVEVTSAETLANYTLSGTFGLTGNPSEAQLINEREVLLTVGNVSLIPSNQTIIVTVAGVTDTYGVAVANINNTAEYKQPQDDTSVGVIAEMTINVFSNKNIIYLHAPETVRNLGFEIFDIQGRIIHSGKINGSTEVETSRSGMYIVRFEDARILPVRVLTTGL